MNRGHFPPNSRPTPPPGPGTPKKPGPDRVKKYQTFNMGYRTETTGSESAGGGIRINYQEIKTAETLKLLWETIDSRLNFSEDVNTACKKANQIIAVLVRLKNPIPKPKVQLYKAAVLPCLTYCHLE